MRGLTKIFALLIITFLGIIFWTNRDFYLSKFDAAYWTDKFEHSQWRLAASNRSIGDDGLYLVEGYRLVGGENPTLLNAEVPPLGKYLIGLAIRYFGNGYLYGFITTVLAVGAVLLLTWVLTKNIFLSLAAGLLITLDPLITAQFSLTMLDSLQMLFLVLSLVSLTLEQPAPTGLFFGLFSASKIPVLSPVIGIVFLYYIWKQKKNSIFCITFIVMSAAGYLLPYIPYFLQGHTLSEWIGVQKYVVSFYAHSAGTITFGQELVTLITEWPLVTVGTMLWIMTKKGTSKTMPIVLTLGIFFFFYLVIPFWTRYLVVILPLLYIATLLFVQKTFPKFLLPAIGIIALFNVIGTYRVLFPTPETAVKQFTYDWSHGYFQDMYEAISAQSKTMTRSEFYRFGQQTLYDGQIEAATIDIKNITNTSATVRVTYHTRSLGSFAQETTLALTKERGLWRIAWTWDNLINKFTAQSRLVTTVMPAKRGTIIQHDVIIARDAPSFLVWITPRLIDPKTENAMLSYLQTVFNNRIPAFRIHNRYAENVVLDTPIPLGITTKPLTQLFAGMTLTPAIGRIDYGSAVGTVANTAYEECCSLLYNTTNYSGVSGLEKQYDTTLKGYDGGMLQLMNGNAVVRTLIDVPIKDGKDVSL